MCRHKAVFSWGSDDLGRMLESTPFERFQWWQMQPQQGSTSSVTLRSSDSEKIYPMQLPFKAKGHLCKGRGRAVIRARARLRAEKLTNFLMSCFSFWECGSPKALRDYVPHPPPDIACAAGRGRRHAS